MSGGFASLDEVDRALDRHAAHCDELASRLVALDGHQGQRLLAAATLTGGSGRLWAEASARQADLWACFETYRAVLAAARAERDAAGRRASGEELARLAALLRGPSAELGGDGDGGGAPVLRLSLDELVRRMDEDHGVVLAVVTAAVDGWSALAQRLDPLTARLSSARASASGLGLGDDPELAAVDAELAGLRSADPLAQHAPAAAERLRAVDARLAAVEARLVRARRLHEEYGALRAGLAARVEDARAAWRRAAQLHATVGAKIAGTAAAAPLGGAELASALAELDRLHGARDWERLADRFAEVDAATARDTTAAQAVAQDLQELLDRRSELRGRLDAYRAKAGRLGHGEDEALAALHRQAHELLWAAPCDLAAATRAVASYQRAVLAAVGPAAPAAPAAPRGEVPG